MPGSAGHPCINIGPWGRDYHHWLERLHAPYAFETLPRALLSVIDGVAKAR
jgi:arginine utilization protein RocB